MRLVSMMLRLSNNELLEKTPCYRGSKLYDFVR